MILDPTWPIEQRLKVADILVRIFEVEYANNPFLDPAFRLQAIREVLTGSVDLLEAQRDSAVLILDQAREHLNIF